jgi:hypothetical protein
LKKAGASRNECAKILNVKQDDRVASERCGRRTGYADAIKTNETAGQRKIGRAWESPQEKTVHRRVVGAFSGQSSLLQR